NHGMARADFAVTLGFGADFADIYEIRGMHRERRGQDLETEISENTANLQYRGLDGVLRRTVVQFSPAPKRLSRSCAAFDFKLEAQESTLLHIAVACERDLLATPVSTFEEARAAVRAELESQTAQYSRIETNS